MRTLLHNMTRCRVLVIGDILLDRYLWGDAERLSPEAPVPVMRVARTTATADGAANVALNLRVVGVDLRQRLGRSLVLPPSSVRVNRYTRVPVDLRVSRSSKGGV
jgi:hypothetical protein